MKVIVAKGREWLGHKEGTELNIKDDYATNLIKRGVVERAKALMRPDHDKQIKGGQESRK